MSEWIKYDGTNKPTSGRCKISTRIGVSDEYIPVEKLYWSIDDNFSDITAYKMEDPEERTDAIGQNGNDGLHYKLPGDLGLIGFDADFGVTVQEKDNTAPALLQEAARIMEERGKQYDKPEGERSMAKTVVMFNTATGRDMTEVEGWFFMECLKNVRFFQNPSKPHEDSVKDKIAYAALFGEAALRRSDVNVEQQATVNLRSPPPPDVRGFDET